MMLHQDGPTHEWVPGKYWDLIVTMDDATKDCRCIFHPWRSLLRAAFQKIAVMDNKLEGIACGKDKRMIQSELCQTAWIFASRKHKAQLYPGSEHLPYLTHIGAVLLELLPALQENAELDADTAICCALLHDTVEDTETTIEEIADKFGEKIAAGVSALTKVKSLKGEGATRDSLDRIVRQPQEIWAVKLADRAANLRTPPDHWGREKRLSYAREGRLILALLGEASPCLSKILAFRINTWEKENND